MSATKTITNAWQVRTLPDIFYEEKERVEDGMLQEETIDRVTHRLRERYEDRTDVFISGDVFISYDISNGNRRVGPDLFIAFDVNVSGIRVGLPNYWIWEIGKGPDFVMEVASPSTANNDLGWKRELYQRLGVQEYWRLDPSGGSMYGQAITGERLVDGVYQPCEREVGAGGTERGYSELLGVVFSWDGVSLFDVLDPATGLTIDKRAVAEAGRAVSEAGRAVAEASAVTEAARANAERQARAAAEARVRELEERLRQQDL